MFKHIKAYFLRESFLNRKLDNSYSAEELTALLDNLVNPSLISDMINKKG